jgi:hypothetical protein
MAAAVVLAAVFGGCSEGQASEGTVTATLTGSVTPAGGKTTTWPEAGELVLTPSGRGDAVRTDIPRSGEVEVAVPVGDYDAEALTGTGSDRFQCGPAQAISVEESEPVAIGFVCPGV